MELIIFALKVWSILWTVISVSMIYFTLVSRPKGMNLTFNFKTCAEWTLYITSIYVCFL